MVVFKATSLLDHFLQDQLTEELAKPVKYSFQTFAPVGGLRWRAIDYVQVIYTLTHRGLLENE
jgi:hypothetical protein